MVFRFKGILMNLDPREGIDRSLIFTPQWFNTEELNACRALLRTGDTAVDLGAHIGSYTLLFAQLVGTQGQVVSVEARPDSVARLEANIALNGIQNVTVIPKGVSDRHEVLTMWAEHSGNRGASTFLDRPADGRDYSAEQVPCVPLTELVVGPVRLLKLDIEGFEERVMRGFFEQSRLRPDFVLTEQWAPATDPSGVIALLQSEGYRLRHDWGNNYLLEWPARPTGRDPRRLRETIDP